MPTPVDGRPSIGRLTRAQVVLGAATIFCYAIGYPLAVVAHIVVGWAFVTIGGAFLLALGAVTIRRIDRSSRTGSSATADPMPGEPAQH
jgi:hypothetical protein